MTIDTITETVSANVADHGDQAIAVSLRHFDVLVRSAKLVEDLLRLSWNNDALASATIMGMAGDCGLHEVRELTDADVADGEFEGSGFAEGARFCVIDPILMEIVASFEPATQETVAAAE